MLLARVSATAGPSAPLDPSARLRSAPLGAARPDSTRLSAAPRGADNPRRFARETENTRETEQVERNLADAERVNHHRDGERAARAGAEVRAILVLKRVANGRMWIQYRTVFIIGLTLRQT